MNEEAATDLYDRLGVTVVFTDVATEDDKREIKKAFGKMQAEAQRTAESTAMFSHYVRGEPCCDEQTEVVGSPSPNPTQQKEETMYQGIVTGEPEAPAVPETSEEDPIGTVTVEDATDDAAAAPTVPAPAPVNRRGRGGLEASVKRVCDAYSEGNLTLADGELLTPHRIRKEIAKSEGVAEPSGGAVSNILSKWAEIGAAVVNEKPLAFTSYTDAAVDDGISALKAAAKAAKKPAPAPEATSDAPVGTVLQGEKDKEGEPQPALVSNPSVENPVGTGSGDDTAVEQVAQHDEW